MKRTETTVIHRGTRMILALFLAMACLMTLTVSVYADVPGRAKPGGAVPNPGTQQQELTNITAPAEWNVFEFVVTCGACHAGTQDQHTGHFGNWAGGNMASAARDPIFRAAQIGANNTVKAVTGQDGAGNVCFRCHSPNGWLSARFDPAFGGKPDGSSMIQSILLSTDGEGIMCETCHRVVGNVTNKRADLSPAEKAWNLLSGLFDWVHLGKAPVDQDGTPTLADSNPYGDTTLQFLDGMTYIGKYSGMTDVYFSDLPIAGTPYTGQIYAVYPDGWENDGNPFNPAPVDPNDPTKTLPKYNSATPPQLIAYNLDGTLPPLFELPISTPFSINPVTNKTSTVFAAQAFSIEHPTVGGSGRGGQFPFVNNGVARTDLLPTLPPGPGGSASPNEFIRTSEFCGSCHDLTVPVLNHGMPEQRTYSEWKYSDYALPSHVSADPLNKRTGVTGVERCQDCHMPTLKHEYTDLDSGSYNADPFLVGGFPYGKNRTAQGGTALHKLTGSNRDLPLMMKALYPEVDLEVIGAPSGMDPRFFPGMLSDRGPMWDRAKQNTEITLRDSVDVQITQAPTVVSAGVYELKVKVTNKSGHRIPSGYPDGRRFWLSVQAKDSTTGTPVYVSGVYDDATATLKTTAADAFKRSLGNFIDATIAGNNAVQVYERVTGMCNDAVGAWIYPDPTAGTPAACTPSPAVINNFILFDNRIPPKGFDAAKARNAGVKFWNYSGTNFVPKEEQNRYIPIRQAEGSDEVTYRFTAPTGSVLTASAELYWQTHTRDFVEHLRADDTSTVRPQGPPNPLDPNYPNIPNYLSDSINGQPLSSYTALDGTALNDNWGGVAYAAWLATGKGAPFLVKRDDTTSVPPTTKPILTASALTAADPKYIDPVTLAPNIFAAKLNWTEVPDADGYTVWIRYGKVGSDIATATAPATADWDRLVTVGKGVTSHIENVMGDASPASPGKTYGFKVVAFNGKGEISSDVVNHTVASGLPAAPTGLTASNAAPGSSATQITLNWTDNATNEAGFEVWRYGPISVGGVDKVYNGLPPLTVIGAAAGGGVATLTGGPAGGVPATGANTYVDADPALLPVACYNYQVRAVTANLDVSTWAVAPSAGCTIAARPTVNVTATPASGYRVDLTWTSNATGVVNYRLTRTLPAPQAPVILPGSAFAYTDTTVTPSTTYTYQVEAIGAASAVLATATVTVTTPAVPLAPTTVQATTTATQITVSWTDNANNEDGFVLERSDNGGQYQQIPAVGAFLPPKTVPAPSTVSYIDTAVLQNVTYQYRVKAIHLVNGDSGYAVGTPVSLNIPMPNLSANSLVFGNTLLNTTSPVQVVTLTNSGTGPLSITSITATAPFAVSQNCGLSLSAVANCTISVTYTPTVAGPVTGSLDITDNAGGVPYSKQSVTLTGNGVNPAIPVLAATLSPLPPATVNLVWSPSSAADTFQVLRTAAGTATLNCATAASSSYTNLGTATTALTAADTTIAANKTYCYKVAATNTVGSFTSVPVKITVPAAPAAPTSLTINGIAPTGLTVNWAASGGTVVPTGYEIQMCSNATLAGICAATGAGWSTKGTTAAINYPVTGLTAGTPYFFRVRAFSPATSGWLNSTVFAQPVAVADSATATASTAATPQNVSIGNVLTNDLPTGAAGRTVIGLTTVTHTGGPATNPATATVSCNTAGACTLALTSPSANNTNALRAASRIGTYTFSYIEQYVMTTYGTFTSGPVTVTVTVK